MLQRSWLENPQAKKLFFALRWPHRAFASKRARAGLVLMLFGLSLLEVFGRQLGLHTPILYEKTIYGYRPLPNQDFRRFGNHVFYDDSGLRSVPVSIRPAAGTRRLLFLGDSVVNGGARVDQTATIPYLVRDHMLTSGGTIEVLNASSPGWALANEAGWLNRYGTFSAHHLILVINTFDLFQEAASSDLVGSHPSFPEHGPGLALIELVNRYLIPRLMRSADPRDPGAELQVASLAITQKALGDLRWILLRARHQGSVGVVVLVEPMVPMPSEALEMSVKAVAMLRRVLIGLDVPLIETRDAMLGAGGAALYRDGIHPTVQGNQIIAEQIARHLARHDGSAR